MRRLIWELCLVVASSIIYCSASLLIIIWKLDIFYYVAMVSVISCMIGAIVVDIKRSIIITYTCTIIGNMIAIAIFLLPYIVFSETVERTNLAIMVVLNIVVKVFLISAITPFLGALLGCYLGEKSLEQIQT